MAAIDKELSSNSETENENSKSMQSKNENDYDSEWLQNEMDKDFDSDEGPSHSEKKPVKRLKKEVFQYIEKKGDIFSSDETSSLAHCISEDCAMGKGIAVLFKKKFGGVQELKAQGKKTGDVAVLKRNKRYVYYLITKQKYWNKPTYVTLRSSLEAMSRDCKINGVTQLAMPRIGCGLDGLKWDKVAELISDVFKDVDITITVYTL